MLLSRTGNDRDRDGHYLSQKVGHAERSESGHKMLKSKRKERKQVERRGWEVGEEDIQGKDPCLIPIFHPIR